MKKYDTSQFEKDLYSFGISLTGHQMDQFLRYYELLVEWNQKMNLTAITEYDEVMKKHFIDSLSLVKIYNVAKPVTVIDVGTGAGFPGLALKIAYPAFKVTLLDSLKKRVNFLNSVINELNLEDVEAVHGRAEDYAKPDKLREKFDLCVSRAVACFPVLSEYCIPFVKVGCHFISYKSGKAAEEISDAGNAIALLGGRVVNQVGFQLPDSDIQRNLIMIEKVKKTPGKYPRKAGIPGKEPIF